MPYSIRGNCVYKGEEKLKCYDNREDALKYFRALQANVKDSVHEISMFISKSSISEGEMRWVAVNSDTDWDLYGERMSLELYKSMISKIKTNAPPPEAFAEFVVSDYWKGGMPYLSIAHYADGNGKAVPGEVRELFVDGTQLKAKGILFDSPLGKAVWKSLKEDEINYKNAIDTDRIRISIAFLDLAHKHGEHGQVFKRSSLLDMCPGCQRGVGEKIYLAGYLVHLALTRVPVNPRTIMLAEEEAMAKRAKPGTKKEDALSVIGDEVLAEEVVKSNLETKSQIDDIMVEMSDTQDEALAPVEEPAAEPEVVEAKSETDEVITVSRSELSQLVKSMIEESANSYNKKDEEDDEADGKKKDRAMDEKSDTVSEIAPVAKSALELSVDKLYNVVNSVLTRPGTAEDKLQEVQPSLEAVGQEIIAVVRSSVGETPVAQAPANAAVLEAIQELSKRFQAVETDVATLKEKSLSVQALSRVEENRVPAPRSITPTTVKSAVTTPANPNSVANIVRRSVDPNLPPVDR